MTRDAPWSKEFLLPERLCEHAVVLPLEFIAPTMRERKKRLTICVMCGTEGLQLTQSNKPRKS